MAFPSNPSVGDTFTLGGKVYRWNGTSWARTAQSVSGQLSSATIADNSIPASKLEGNVLTPYALDTDLTTANVIETGNLYFTNSRTVSALTSGYGIEIAANGLISALPVVSGSVTTVNGESGAVTLVTANINEDTNLYFTNARAYANISLGFPTNAYVETRLSSKANIGDLATGNVPESGGRLYFTTERAIGSISGGYGIIKYSNGMIMTNADALGFATTSYVSNEVANLVASAPATLDTLNEIAAALNDDASFANNIITILSNKANVASLTTANVSEANNLYFTNVRVQQYLGNVSGNILPSDNEVFNLGSSTKRFKDLYLSGNTIALGETLLSADPVTGGFTISSSNAERTGSITFSVEANAALVSEFVTTNVITVDSITANTWNQLYSSNIIELTNLFYTDERVYSNVDVMDLATNNQLSLYVETSQFTTDYILEASNLFFTNNRAVAAFTAGSGVVIASNGLISSTALGGVTSVNGSTGDIELYYTSNTAPNANTLGSIWYKGDQGNIYLYINDGSSNLWVEIDVTGAGTSGTLTSVFGQTTSVSNAQLACAVISSGVLTTANTNEVTNLYFTNVRAIGALTAGANISIDANGLVTALTQGGGGGGTVTSVFGQTTSVSNAQLACAVISSGVLNTDNVAEGANLYFTNTRAISSLASGSGILIAANGLITNSSQYTDTDARAALSAGVGVIYDSGAGVIAISQNVDKTSSVEFHDILVSGNLTVTGNTVTISTTSLAVEDNMIYLNANSSVSNPDLGFAGNYNDGTYHHAGLFRDASDGVWKFFENYQPEPDASPYIDTAHGTFRLANVQATTFYGNVNGTVTSLSNHSTTDLTEGNNLYFTNTRAISSLTGGSGISIAANGLVTSTVSGGVTSVDGLTGAITNSQLANSILYSGVLTTANTSEVTNLYFTNARVGTYLTGTLQANIIPATDAVYTLGNATHRFNELHLAGATYSQQTIEKLNTKTGATGTVTHDFSTGAIFYHSSISGNFTANFTNVPTTNDKAITLSLVLSQGATPYIASAVQIDGSAQTIKWANGTTPTGSASNINIQNFTLIRTSSTWTVLGSVALFS